MKPEAHIEPSRSETDELHALRPYLFKIAYNMTGVVEEAEDIVHEVYEKWLTTNRSDIGNLKAYLARMTVNRSINRLNELKARRESYTGFWLPEPYITLETDDSAPSIDFALLTLLERLSPVERAVFILRESFSETYAVIAELTGETEQNCRQLLHRSREKIRQDVARPVEPQQHRALTEAFLSALHQQDRSALERLLRKDIELYSDGGGKKAAALKPLFGVEKVVKFLIGVAKLGEAHSASYTYRHGYFNGHPATLLFEGDRFDSAFTIGFNDKGISQLLYVRNPDKLKIR